MNTLTVVALIAFVLIAVAGVLLFPRLFFSAETRKADMEINGSEFRVEVADSAISRAQGLSGREGLGQNEGMLFVFGSASNHQFWMKDMKFSIDIIWIRDGVVVGITEGADAEQGKKLWELTRYSPPEPADMVLEVRSGGAAEMGISIGDEFPYRRE